MKEVLGKVKKFWLVGILAAAMSVVLAACGDSNPPPANPTAAATVASANTPDLNGAANTAVATNPTNVTTKASNSVSVVLTEWEIRPKLIGLPAGKVTFTVTNEGQFGHDLVIEGTDGRTPVFKAQQGPQTFTVDLKPGTYKWYCDVPQHAERGMLGQITVK